MSLYSKNGAYPETLPHRIVLSDGRTRTDNTTFTAEEIADAGYVAVPDRPTATYPNKIVWSDGAWIERAPTDIEIDSQWTIVRRDCKLLLDASDYKIIKSLEANTTPDTAWVQYRQELRDLYNNVNNIDPWNIVWPAKPTANTEPTANT